MSFLTPGKQKQRKIVSVNDELDKVAGYLTDEQAKEWLVDYLAANPGEACKLISGVEMFSFQEIAIRTMLQRDYFLAIWSRGMSKCVDADAWTITNEGIKQVKEVKKGEKIVGKKYLRDVLDTTYYPEDHGIEIKTHKGYTLKAKVGHRLLVDKDWKLIEELKVGDSIKMFGGQNVWGSSDILKPHLTEEVKLFIYEFLGFIFQFAKRGKRDKEVSIRVPQSHKMILDVYINKLFLIENVHKVGEASVITDYDFRDLLERINFFDKVGTEKQTPRKLLLCKKEYIVSFVNGLLRYAHKNYLLLKHKDLTEVLNVIFMNCGIFCSIRGRKIKFNRGKFILFENFKIKENEYLKRGTDRNFRPHVNDKVKSITLIKLKTVDFMVNESPNYWTQGFVNHNSFSTGIYAFLQAIFKPGSRIAIISAVFRQSRAIFNKIEEFAHGEYGVLLRQCLSDGGKLDISHKSDEWVMRFGTKGTSTESTITALPLGNGQKLRGMRFNVLIIDELLLIPKKIIEEVLKPFISVRKDSMRDLKLSKEEDQLIAMGAMKEEDRTPLENPKVIGLSSASYKYEYLYELYCNYIDNINKGNNSDGTYAVMTLSYNVAEDLKMYNKSVIDDAKNSMTASAFKREYMGEFTEDSSGYYNMKTMKDATIAIREMPCARIKGDPSKKYVLGMDPSWSKSEGSDDFAMVLLELDEINKTATAVHAYALPGKEYKEHIIYLNYLINNFNIVLIWMDPMGGGLPFLEMMNETAFKKEVQFKSFEADFLDPVNHQKNLNDARNNYNLKDRSIIYFQNSSSDWIKAANANLQKRFETKQTRFASPLKYMEDLYTELVNKSDLDVDDLVINKAQLGEDEAENKHEKERIALENRYIDKKQRGEKIVDLIEINDMNIDKIKSQCALIEQKITDNGSQTFGLPSNLKATKGPNKARKDCYSAMLLANWGAQCYFELTSAPIDDSPSGFIPFAIKRATV